MQLSISSPLATPAKPKSSPETPVDSRVRSVANAMHAKDILSEASKLFNEMVLLAHRCRVTSRSTATGKPTGIEPSEPQASRFAMLLPRLRELSATYTELVNRPADHAHKSQPNSYTFAAARMANTDAAQADAISAEFGHQRTKFLRSGSAPVDFLSFIRGTVSIVEAALDLRANGDASVRRLRQSENVVFLRRRAGQDIDASARVVKNEVDFSGQVGDSEANKLSSVVAAVARIGVGAGLVAVAAMKDVSDDIKIRHHATPFDNLRTMRPVMA